jgi:hypothetical protein
MQKKALGGTNSMFNQTGMSKMNQTGFGRGNNTTMNGFGNNTTTGGGGFGLNKDAPHNPENYILEGVALELEMKSSDFATVVSKNLIEAAILQVSLDRDNVMDLCMSRDLSESAQLEV